MTTKVFANKCTYCYNPLFWDIPILEIDFPLRDLSPKGRGPPVNSVAQDGHLRHFAPKIVREDSVRLSQLQRNVKT
jgi:hypothetical protein